MLEALVAACAHPPDSSPEPIIRIEAEEQPAAEEEPPPECLEIERIEVWKEERTLRAYCKRGAVIAFRIALGREEVGPKLRSGDHRTPEGKYRIAGTARSGRFHLFIPIDYPSRVDAELGLADGRLSEADYRRIIDAHDQGLPPPDETALGGNLGFHGEGERWQGDSEYIDWTYGCIAMTDEQIGFLSQHVEPGVPVEIHP